MGTWWSRAQVRDPPCCFRSGSERPRGNLLESYTGSADLARQWGFNGRPSKRRMSAMHPSHHTYMCGCCPTRNRPAALVGQTEPGPLRAGPGHRQMAARRRSSASTGANTTQPAWSSRRSSQFGRASTSHPACSPAGLGPVSLSQATAACSQALKSSLPKAAVTLTGQGAGSSRGMSVALSIPS